MSENPNLIKKYAGVANSQAKAVLLGYWGEPVEIWAPGDGSPGHPGCHAVLVRRSVSIADALASRGVEDLDDVDCLLFERGGIWREELPRLGRGGTAETPMTIGAFGAGARPKIIGRFPIRSANHHLPLDHLMIEGLELAAPDDWNGESGDCVGIWIQRTGKGMVIRDCLVSGFANNIVIEGMEPNGRRDVAILDTVCLDPFRVDAGCTNVHIASTNGLVIGGCAIINRQANERRGSKVSHGLYLSESNTPGASVVTDSVIYNHRTNITLRGGGYVTRCMAIRGGGGITSSQRADAATPGMAVIGENIVTESRDHWDGQELGQGIHCQGIYAEILNNVVFGASDGSAHVGITLADAGGLIIGNTVHNWTKPEEGETSPALVVRALDESRERGSIEVERNTLQHHHQNWLVWDRTPTAYAAQRVAWKANRYFTARGKQFLLDEDRRGWVFENWKEGREPDALWGPGAWGLLPNSLADIEPAIEVLGQGVEGWLMAMGAGHDWNGERTQRLVERAAEPFRKARAR